MDSTTARQSSVFSPAEALPQRYVELFELAALLKDPAGRAESARMLARRAGAEDLIIFILDPEIGVLLPAPGFRQTLPDARRWHAFLSTLRGQTQSSGRLPYPSAADETPALAVAGSDGSVLVLLGGEPVIEIAQALRVVLPVLAGALQGEQAVLAAGGHASVAREAAGQAKLLAGSLDNARAALQEALGVAEAANKAKDQFLAVLSHELRTPLAPVLTTVTALLAGADLSDDVRHSLEIVRRNAELEARLIDDLLDLTRVAKGKMPLNFDAVDAHTLIIQTLEICQSDIYRNKLQVKLDLNAAEHFVRADPTRLQQVFWNLVKNAIKFTPAGGRVEIASRNDGEHIVIEVCDSGIGIEPDHVESIFDAFEQTSPAVTRRFGGLGLGLAISKALIQAHDGKIVAWSPGKGRGATFAVTMAVIAKPATAARERHGASPRDATKGLKVLLVEDHHDTAAVMSRLLKTLGHDVCIAGSIAAALELAQRQPFDLVLSDLGLPDGSGLDLMRQLKQTFGLRGVAISGYGTEDDILRAQEAGFIAHLTKPVNFQQVLAVLNQFSATHHS